ncbi:MAG TPA: metabolite traffic protein EboE [Chryseosolibacter sp.]|nr:metabolite traffic protein EboE [Chryseosolibacter sp.]
METFFGHLTYCTNIHAGESWADHFAALKENIPKVKEQLSPDKPFGIGLRLSHLASLELGKKEVLENFREWLDKNQCYVFVVNGFPYGGFHHTKVKDQVHAPDWTTQDRVLYTIQLFNILSALLPKGMEGGVSTSPLSYRHWHSTVNEERAQVFDTSTENVLKVVQDLIGLRQATGQLMHLDIEPEPDGLIGNGPEFISWYKERLIPQGIAYLEKYLGFDEAEARAAIHDHIQLCYDICHFAVGYEDHAAMIRALELENIKVGRIQISAALKGDMAPNPVDRGKVIEAFKQFNESTYLHQVVARQEDLTFVRYPDLPEALSDANNSLTREWRSHFHVPLFVEDYGALQSTQSDIQQVLSIQKRKPFSPFMEVETYTWEVLPDKLRLPLKESIVRELQWVRSLLISR